jgi:signal transduction histidine kinase
MDRLNQPIPLIYNNITFGFLHYGDSHLIQKLQWWTYIELGAIGIFIFLGFFGFTFIRNNEKRHIWVGMARETAHQLGTPVSALMGWVDWLKEHPDKTSDIIPDIKADLQRLQQIGRRFSKMGSKPDMKVIDLSQRVEKVVSYLSRRMPTLGKKVKLVNDIESGVMIRANGSLLSWSIENVVRNGIDAIDRDNGEINVSLRMGDDHVRIRIKDNGRGVPKKDWKNVFRPGFSTKQAGWGLGLSLAQRIIEEIHHGKLIIVKSSSVTGTIFELIIPSQ